MKKKLLTIFIITSMLLTALPLTVFAQSDFKDNYADISGKWYADAAAKYGYPEVFSDGRGSFYADRDITRMEFVRLMHRALNIQINYFAAPDVTDSFDDMQNTDVWANELIDLVTTGIVESGGNFNPNKSLLREEMIHWIMNAVNYKTNGQYPIPMVKPVPFNDDAQIADDFRGEIYSSVVLKLVNGRGGNMLFPKDGATRAEAVTIVSRLTSLLDSYGSEVVVSASAAFADDGALAMSLTIRNNTDEPIVISHTSGQKYDFKLFDASGSNVYTWSADKMFIMLMNETSIAAGEEMVFSDTIDSGTNHLISSAVTLSAYIVGTSDDFTVESNGYTAEIEK